MTKPFKQYQLGQKPFANGAAGEDQDFTSSANVLQTAKTMVVKKVSINEKELDVQQGYKLKVKKVVGGNASIYSVLLDDYLIGIEDTTISRTVKLPKPSLAGFGKLYIVKDASGGAGSTTVTINPYDTETIDGEATKSISSNYGGAILYTDSINWFSIPKEGGGGVSNTTAKARATRDSTQSIDSGSFTKVQLNDETYDPGGNYDNATNYRFTAPVSGYYQCNAAIQLDNPNDGVVVILSLYKNGSEYSTTRTVMGATTDASVNISDIIELAATDYVELFVFHAHGSARDIDPTGSGNFLSVHLLST